MKKKRFFSLFLSACLLFPVLSVLSGCKNDTITLRVYSWEEYIDEGGEDSYAASEENPEPLHVAEEFENWYKAEFGKKVNVEYSTFGTNEDLYNQLKLGDSYDLICPSDYMIIKLAAENMLESYDENFFDVENEYNYYVRNVSPFIRDVFRDGTVTVNGETHSWEKYAAGYMWGTTGLVYNPEFVDGKDLEEQGWSILLNPKYKGKVTTKDNVRDSYFVGLAIVYEKELWDLKTEYGDDPDAYNAAVTEIMNRTDEDSVKAVQKVLLEMKKNIFGFETDTGKNDMMTGKIWLNFAWGGDAVYAMNEAEDKLSVELAYYIPQESSNLFFDGWAIPKNDKRDPAVKAAAQAFVNFLSRPDIAVRNQDYIGYTSVIAGGVDGDDVLDYINENYAIDESEEGAVPYDISYFFGSETIVYIEENQLERQFHALYPTKEDMLRCAVMDYYYDRDARINELWTQVKGTSLDGWAIAVLVIAVVAIALFFVVKVFGEKIEWRRKAKKGYELVKQEPAEN